MSSPEFVSALSTILPPCYLPPQVLTWLELIGVLIVTVQVILRLLTVTTVYPQKYKSVFVFMYSSPLFLLDLLVIIPATYFGTGTRGVINYYQVISSERFTQMFPCHSPVLSTLFVVHTSVTVS